MTKRDCKRMDRLSVPLHPWQRAIIRRIARGVILPGDLNTMPVVAAVSPLALARRGAPGRG